jgi:hypothetical protein
MRVKRSFAVQVVTDPHEAVRRVVYGAGTLEACAEAVGVSHQTLSKQLNEEDGAGLSLRRSAAIEAFMDSDALAECFAARRNGVFIKLPPADGGPGDLVAGYSKVLSAFAEASKDFSEAVADGRVTPAEVDRFQKHWREACQAGEQLVRAARALAVEERR